MGPAIVTARKQKVQLYALVPTCSGQNAFSPGYQQVYISKVAILIDSNMPFQVVETRSESSLAIKV